MAPLVSVIIPMYNCEEYIERCVSSVIDQSYENIQVIVVDDGSTDKGAKIVKNYAKKDNRVKYIYQENEGPSIARNNAINNSDGKYLLFVDADDYVGSEYIEKLVSMAEKNRSELVITGYTMVYEDGRKDKVIIPIEYEKLKAEEWAYRISACCSRMYSREFWDKNCLQFYKEEGARAEDVPIVLYSNIMARNISIVKDAGYFYYQHQGSAMNNKEQKVAFVFPYVAFMNMYRKILKEDLQNSLIFFQIGILKFLAQFDLVIYRNAPQDEKKRFCHYIHDLIGEDYGAMVDTWNRSRMKVKFPILHKIAIQIFVWKYRSIIER